VGAFVRVVVILVVSASLWSCGRLEDTEGDPVEAGREYVMSEEGLRPLPEREGDPLRVGREHVTFQGQYLADRSGERLRVGNEYAVTGEGFKLLKRLHISGKITDLSGLPLQGVRAFLKDSPYQGVTDEDGRFQLPFLRGYVRIGFRIPSAPPWCEVPEAESLSLDLERHPDGWDAGDLKASCVLVQAGESTDRWGTVDGRFVDNGDGILTDLEKGLVWPVKVRMASLDAGEALSACEAMDLGGHTGWRLPSLEELEELHRSGVACPWGDVPLVQGAMNVWSGDVKDGEPVSFNVCSGRASWGPRVHTSAMADLLAVRSAGE